MRASSLCLVILSALASLPGSQSVSLPTKDSEQALVATQAKLGSGTVTWPVLGAFPEGSGRCAASDGSEGLPSTDYDVSADVLNLEECKRACVASSTCLAIGFSTAGGAATCHLWKSMPSKSKNVQSWSCLRKVAVASGTSLCGDNHFAQLGLGQSKSANVLNDAPVHFTKAALGNYHSLFLVANELYGTGNNMYGQLGLGDFTQRTSPVRATLPGSHTISMIAAGGSHSIVVTSNGQVFTFGRNSHGQLCSGDKMGNVPVPQLLPLSNIKAAAAGFAHTVFVTNENTLMACGNNKDGQLGMGDYNEYLTPTAIPNVAEVQKVACGAKHTLVLSGLQGSSDGTCGAENREVLDPAGMKYALSSTPRSLRCASSGLHYVDGSCGHLSSTTSSFGYMTITLPADTTIAGIVVQGNNLYAEWTTKLAVQYKLLGERGFTDVPGEFLANTDQHSKVFIDFPSKIVAGQIRITPKASANRGRAGLRASLWTCAAADPFSEVKAFGSNAHGQLGTSTNSWNTPTNVPLAGFDGKPLDIAAGQSHSVVALSSGKVVVFGFNFFGQLGLPSSGSVASDIADELSPTYMETKDLSISRVEAGASHTVLMTKDSVVYTVGRNYDGQLAIGTFSEEARELTRVPTGFSPTDIVAGGGVTVVLA